MNRIYLIPVAALLAVTAYSCMRADAVTSMPVRKYTDLDRVRIDASIPSQEKEYEGFRVSFNKDNGTPNWVAWELLGSETDGPVKRSNNVLPPTTTATRASTAAISARRPIRNGASRLWRTASFSPT